MASNLKVDIVKPTATNGSLSLKGDSGGSATANGISVDSSGDTSITGTTTIGTADINGGNIDGTTIGGTTPAAGTFTSVDATSASLDGAVTINESGANVDFRVESDTNGNALFVEGSSGNVGIGTNSPNGVLELNESSSVAATSKTQTGYPNLIIKDISGDYTADMGSAVSFEGVYGALAKIAGIKANGANSGGSRDFGELVFYTNGNSSENSYAALNEAMRIDSSGYLLAGYSASNGSYKLQVNSQIYATSSTIATSDGNYKENITPLDSALFLVSQLNPVQFDWKEHPVHEFDRNQPTVGFIAQEVQKVLSDQPYVNSIVKPNECIIEPEEIDEEGNVIKEALTEEFLGIAEGNMIALLTKAIQEQQTIIESQQAQIDALSARLDALENPTA